jgi:hypothetical protein
MYLGGVISNTEVCNPTTGDDKVLLITKGFDEHSFKTKSPGKKYKRRMK